MSNERRRQLERISRAASEAREVREGVGEEEAVAAELVEEEQPRPKRPSIFNVVAYESWVDQQIRRAQERGAFDNLRGKGQPLAPDDQNVVAFAGDDAMGLKLLKNSEALPAWIELNKEIAGDRAACRRILDYYVAERDRDRRARFADDYRRRVRDLNQKIDQYNLIVPAAHLEQIRVRPELELRDADKRRWARYE
jgi:DnaJ homolog subfamily C member 28